jgi:hypothetical protein
MVAFKQAGIPDPARRMEPPGRFFQAKKGTFMGTNVHNIAHISTHIFPKY